LIARRYILAVLFDTPGVSAAHMCSIIFEVLGSCAEAPTSSLGNRSAAGSGRQSPAHSRRIRSAASRDAPALQHLVDEEADEPFDLVVRQQPSPCIGRSGVGHSARPSAISP
jgi:hypothetical protein